MVGLKGSKHRMEEERGRREILHPQLFYGQVAVVSIEVTVHNPEGVVEIGFPFESCPHVLSVPAPSVPTITHQIKLSPAGMAGEFHVYVPVVPISHVLPDNV